jgi:glycosyltransferase involved in cell wall biosynthesis
LNGILVCDYIPAHVLPRLLRAASALVSPSTLEGFGLPVLEAMTAGVPVVAVRSPSAEEVCSHAALLVDNDQRSLTEGLLRVLRDTTLRRSLVAAGLDRAKSFTWDNAAQALVSVYREFASTPRRSDPRRGSVSR